MPDDAEIAAEGGDPRKALSDLSTKELGDLVDQMVRQRVGQIQKTSSPEGKEQLLSLYERFITRSTFAAGQLVCWKDDLKNRRRPDYGVPMVVTQVLHETVFDSARDSGTPYFREPLDVVIGFLDDDGELVLLHLDSRRLKPYEE